MRKSWSKWVQTLVVFVLVGSMVQLLPKDVSALGGDSLSKTVSAGNSHTLLIGSDGYVYSMGVNNYGQLGLGYRGYDSNYSYPSIPTKIPGISNAIAVSAGGSHSLILTSDGSVYSFGYGYNGQLGHPYNNDLPVPTKINTITNAVGISAGYAHSLILTSDGSVYSFGYNYEGQLGLGDVTPRNTPTKIPTISNAIEVSAGDDHSNILTSNGDVYSFGYNDQGQLGHGDSWGLSIPTKIATISNAVSVSASNKRTFILTSDGSVYATGLNDYGQLGIGDYVKKLVPTKLTGISNAVSVEAGYNHTLITTTDGSIYSFGMEGYGQLGHGFGNTMNKIVPSSIPNINNVTGISAGNNFSFALTSDGSVYSFGYNYFGQLGNGNNSNQLSPTKIAGFQGIQPSVKISTCTELQNMKNNLSGKYALANDIDCSASSTWNSGAGFIPIGDVTNWFKGEFDGKGKKIKNLVINRPTENNVGLFGMVSIGKIQNVGVENINVTGKNKVGGIAGNLSDREPAITTIANSYVTGKVTGIDSVGGLVGELNQSYVTNSYATANATGDNKIGGLIGGASFSFITHSYATGKVTGPSYGGGLVGSSNSTITNSYFDTNTTGRVYTGHGLAYTTAQMKTQTNFVGWDFNTVWIMNAPNTDGYPKLRGNIEEIKPNDITTCTELQNMKNNLTVKYQLTSDIDCTGVNFTPVGNDVVKFKGSFDGKGYVIRNLTINRPTTDYIGLFGLTEGATLTAVKLENVHINGKTYVGAIVGYANNTTIRSSYAKGVVVGSDLIVGGLVGYNGYASQLIDSYANVDVTGQSTVGGVVGQSFQSSISTTYATGNVSSLSNVGGLVGANVSSSTVINSYATGTVNGTNTVGGLVGQNVTSSSVIHSYSVGKVIGSSSVGGLIGVNNATVTNSYFDYEKVGQMDTGKGTRYTTVQMKTKANYGAWDFTNTWIIDAPNTDGYPKLRNNLETMALDITPPVGILTLSQETWTKNSVIITALGTDAESGMKQIELPSGIMRVGDTATYTVSTNGTYTFVFEDMVGNITVKSIVVGNIDQTKPTVSFTLDIPAPTNQNITITANGLDVGGSGVMRIQKPDGTYESGATATYSVTTNGTYAFTIEDNTGNSYTESVTITTIDKLNPTGLLTADVVTPTNEKVTVTANGSDTGGSGFKHILKPDGSVANGTSTTYIVSANGTYTFIFEDHAGNNVSQSITVNNIMVDLATKDPAAAYPFYQGKTFTIKEPGVMDATYTYLGILVSRKTPTTDNSLSAATYTKTYTHTDGKSEWFIPKSEAFNGEYALPYNEAVEYHKRLFSLVGTNYIYKLDVKHVYRLPDGRDIVGDTQSLYYILDVIAPTGTLTQNPDTFTKGNVTITATGTDIGVSGFQRIQKPDGTYVGATNTTYVVSANGTYTFTFEDRAGNKSSKQITISNIDKAVPTVAFNPPSRDWANLPSSVGLTFTDSGVSGYKEHRYAWTNSTDRPSAGWSTWNTSPTPTITQSGEGVWYLHVEVQDRAGNVGYQYAGTYKVDTSAPVLDMDFTEIEDEQIYSSMGTNKVNFTGKVTENNLTSRVEVYYAIENESTGVKVTTSDVLLLDKADNVHESPFAGTYRIDPSMKNGVYTLLVFAKNHLGLTSTKSVTFEVANPTSKPSVNIMIHPQPTGTWVNSYIDTYTTDSGDISLLAGAEKKYEVTNSPVYPSTFTKELPTDRKVTLQQVGINYLHVQYTLEDGTVISSTAGPYLLDTGAVGDFATTLEDNAGIPVNGWTNKELFLVISDPVTTPISGMTKQYRVENYHTEWQTYTGKTKITTEGDARIFARILTKAGTPSDQQVVRAQLDRSLPIVRSMQLDVTKDNLYHVLVRTTDELSGVVEVKTDVQPLPNTASDQYKLGGIGSKPTSVTITDKAGNVVAGIPFAAEPGVAFDAPYSLSAPVYREDVFARLTGDHDISYKIGNKQMICTANPCPITISQNNTLTAIHTEGNKQTTKVYAIQNIHKEKLNLVLQAQRDKMDPSSIKFSWNYTIASGNLHCIESGNALTYTVAGTSNTQTGKNYLYDCRLVATYGGEVLTSNRILLYPDKTHPLDADGDTNLTKVETNIYIEESRVGTSYFINAKSNNFKYEKIPLPENDITKN